MLNKIMLIGNLGKDPEVRYTADGLPIANFSVATSEKWTDKGSGRKKERTDWHRIAVFGKVAELCGEYLKKGSKVYVEGKLQTRKWQGQDGQDKYTTEVVVDFGGAVKFLDRAEKSGGRPTHDEDSIPF